MQFALAPGIPAGPVQTNGSHGASPEGRDPYPLALRKVHAGVLPAPVPGLDADSNRRRLCAPGTVPEQHRPDGEQPGDEDRSEATQALGLGTHIIGNKRSIPEHT